MHILDRVLGKTPGQKRSSKWRGVRKDFLALNPKCVSCGGTKKLEVHHVIAFHEDPSLELEPSNLMTLCSRKKYGISCHSFCGHRGSYRDINPNAREKAKETLLYLEVVDGKKKC